MDTPLPTRSSTMSGFDGDNSNNTGDYAVDFASLTASYGNDLDAVVGSSSTFEDFNWDYLFNSANVPSSDRVEEGVGLVSAIQCCR